MKSSRSLLACISRLLKVSCSFSSKGPHVLQEPPSIHSKLPEFPELRVSTITPASINLLQKTVDWQDIAPPKSAAFSKMQVLSWGSYIHGHFNRSWWRSISLDSKMCHAFAFLIHWFSSVFTFKHDQSVSISLAVWLLRPTKACSRLWHQHWTRRADPRKLSLIA